MQSVNSAIHHRKVDNIQRKATRAVRQGKAAPIRFVPGFRPGQVIRRSLLAFHGEPQQARFCPSKIHHVAARARKQAIRQLPATCKSSFRRMSVGSRVGHVPGPPFPLENCDVDVDCDEQFFSHQRPSCGVPDLTRMHPQLASQFE